MVLRLSTAAVFERISLCQAAVSGQCGQCRWIELDEGVQNHLYSCQLEGNGVMGGAVRVVGWHSVELEEEEAEEFRFANQLYRHDVSRAVR